MTVIDSTITQNGANRFDGDGIFLNDGFTGVNFIGEPATLTVRNSIIADNAQVDTSQEFLSNSIDVTSSIIGNAADTLLVPTSVDGTPDADGNLIGTNGNVIDPGLAGLADNGGPTQTHALLASSPAINSGNSALAVDQRGETRIVGFANTPTGNGADIGAFERQTLALTVDTNSDVVDGDFSAGNRSLREAINLSNASPGLDEILFAPEVFDGQFNDVIRLQLGELLITDEVTIDGNGANVIVSADVLGNDIFDPATFITDVDASLSTGALDDNSRVFNIATAVGEVVTLSDLTVTGGNANSGGGGIFVGSSDLELVGSFVSGNRSLGSGGGILTDQSLTLTNSTVSGNVAENRGAGGGIAATSGLVTLNNSNVTENQASGSGGGIQTFAGDVVLNDSAVSNNTIDGGSRGGGIATTSGSVTLNDSVISGNESDFQAGGIYTNNGAVSVNNSTVSGNQSVQEGGGIATNTGTVSLSDSTLSNNSTTQAGGEGGGISTTSGDISPFITLLSTSGEQDEADINRDNVVNFLDISPFITLLSS